ncbi:hypothetical protein PV325_012932 [Microctonus aethiopoides]|uniref:riboflavin kinase n=1 Tax=Microctonus aethiopoides TaxID=144406 RepID=A0AA39KXH3_9HYME|nr:hypothetical protein PV325_012932 [Microctonus aethiopoides]KAK0084533.1 hypothetical protein PV326_006240 [Microctonus aethiopoides]KAK0177370.1 hypothetical protein PV328_001432 [Microctonus aethiopoides]
MSSGSVLPYFISGVIVKGFGRGSRSLGIPTANISQDVVDSLSQDFKIGVYYGWAALEGQIYKMVMSIGWNPFYKNEKKSMEVHMLHKFDNDLYGKYLKIAVMGFIRPERDFASLADLIKEINNDVEIANTSLNTSEMIGYKSCEFLNS